MKYFNILILLIVSTGCTSVSQKLDTDVFYKRDMSLKVNGYQAEGVLVVPESGQYKFDIRAQGKLDLFTFTTCHREQTKENAGEQGWFSDDHRRRFDFRPVRGIETGGLSCPAQLGGYEKKRGRHSWGFVDFQSRSLKLPALLKCNGSARNFTGVSACQSRVGLIQEISFSETVMAAQENTCLKVEPEGKVFRFKMPPGECTLRFVTKSGEKKWHRITLIGYAQILIRED